VWHWTTPHLSPASGRIVEPVEARKSHLPGKQKLCVFRTGSGKLAMSIRGIEVARTSMTSAKHRPRRKGSCVTFLRVVCVCVCMFVCVCALWVCVCGGGGGGGGGACFCLPCSRQLLTLRACDALVAAGHLWLNVFIIIGSSNSILPHGNPSRHYGNNNQSLFIQTSTTIRTGHRLLSTH